MTQNIRGREILTPEWKELDSNERNKSVMVNFYQIVYLQLIINILHFYGFKNNKYIIYIQYRHKVFY